MNILVIHKIRLRLLVCFQYIQYRVLVIHTDLITIFELNWSLKNLQLDISNFCHLISGQLTCFFDKRLSEREKSGVGGGGEECEGKSVLGKGGGVKHWFFFEKSKCGKSSACLLTEFFGFQTDWFRLSLPLFYRKTLIRTSLNKFRIERFYHNKLRLVIQNELALRISL